jgi:hypothetical protein
MMEAGPVKSARYGFMFSLIGGIIDAFFALLLLPAYTSIQNTNDTSVLPFTSGDVTITVIIGLLLAMMVIVGAFLIKRPGREMIGSIIVIVFSILGLFYTVGGLFVGLFFGIIGGILGFFKK